MKKVFLTIIVTMLVMLVIGNGLGLVYLSYKCDKANKELYNLKISLASKGIVDIEDISVSTDNRYSVNNGTVTIEDNESPQANNIEKLEDNEEYQKYIKLGIENIDEIVDELPNYYAAMALEEILGCDFNELEGVNWRENKEDADKESEEVWEDVMDDLAKDIFDIVNSNDDIETKKEKLEAYGYLAYPVVKNINESLKNDEEIMFDNCEVDENLSIKQIKGLREYEVEIDLNDDEKEALEKYVYKNVK